jgi:hypothetical protein
MGWRRPRRERRQEPWHGYKLGHPMVSADGARVGFSGVSLGRGHGYGVRAEAVCVQGARHRPPGRWCDCGFYCFYGPEQARALACDPEYHGAILLEVTASGRYIRYEQGLRYAKQTVTAAWVGRCECGWAAQCFAETGHGIVGWRQLAPVCQACTGARPTLSLAGFSSLAGGVPVRTDTTAVGFATDPRAANTDDTELAPPLLAAEIALLHARLDQLQTRLDGLGK